MKKIFELLLCSVLLFGFVSCDKDKTEEEIQDEVIGIIENFERFNGHEYVDLGLPSGLLWATCNVGASKPEEYGDYFAWGETKSKRTFSKDFYQFGQYDSLANNYKLTKYNVEDKKTTLELEDDAARVNLGGKWRMPTRLEFQELLDSCMWTWTTNNEVRGYEVKSKINDNSIFLPIAGNRNESGLSDVGSVGSYWSSSLYTNDPLNLIAAYGLYLDSDYYTMADDTNVRYNGYSVRAVCDRQLNRE